MADQEQLELLKSGVAAWNQWRLQNFSVKINLAEADLSRAHLREANLWQADLSGADLWQVNLSGADLSGADLSGADLSGADLSGADLSGADLSDADLSQADLSGANLSGAHLSGANLSQANLWRANLREAHLRQVDLSGADLREAKLNEADLNGAKLNEADLIGADLNQANLSRANLGGANFSQANLSHVNLRGAILRETNLSEANLREVNLSGADLNRTDLSKTIMGNTTFGNTDLGQAHGLETVDHHAPSTIGTDTLQFFKGNIPEVFLRGCGLSDIDIEYSKLANPDLTNEDIVKIQYRMFDLRATQSIQIAPLFISYSHADKPFVDHLDSSLTAKGVRFWRDIHDATAGRMETQIDRAIRQNPTVLLVLSKNSLNSDWVQHEVRAARNLEKELGRDALCPVALDDSWKSAPWPARLMEQVMEYNILDFSGWRDDSTFEAKFAKLLSGLDLFYKKTQEQIREGDREG